jgi:hypothetical protein
MEKWRSAASAAVAITLGNQNKVQHIVQGRNAAHCKGGHQKNMLLIYFNISCRGEENYL